MRCLQFEEVRAIQALAATDQCTGVLGLFQDVNQLGPLAFEGLGEVTDQMKRLPRDLFRPTTNLMTCSFGRDAIIGLQMIFKSNACASGMGWFFLAKTLY